MKFEYSGQIFGKVSNIKFHRNPSSGSRIVPCGQTDMTKLIVAFRYSAKAPKELCPWIFAGHIRYLPTTALQIPTISNVISKVRNIMETETQRNPDIRSFLFSANFL